MMNHFYFSYCGNKRQEVERIFDKLDFTGITTIVEPFCGSCALSYYISTKYPNKFKYILNDVDKNLVDLLNLNKNPDEMLDIENEFEEIKKDITEDKYKDYVKNGLKGYIFGNKYYYINPNNYPDRDMKRFNKVFKFEDYPIHNFLLNEDVEIYNKDAIEIIEEYDNEKCIIFLDPPYINSCNMMYSESKSNIYEYLNAKQIRNFKNHMFICHENSWLFKLMFRDYIKNEDEYAKTYNMGNKKHTTHILIYDKIHN